MRRTTRAGYKEEKHISRSCAPVAHKSRLVKSDNYSCLGMFPLGIRRYSTRYVRYGTVTHVETVQQTPGRYKVGTVHKSGQYMIYIACTVPPCCRLVVRGGSRLGKKKGIVMESASTSFPILLFIL